MFPIPREIAAKTQAQRFPFSLKNSLYPGCFVSGSYIVYGSETGEIEEVVRTGDVPLLGEFNLHNVLAAVSVGKLLQVATDKIASAIRNFQPLEHRLELVGTYLGITFYNASIATVPEATIEHLNTLGQDVATILLGGYDRHLDFSNLANHLLRSQVKTLILFPATGQQIWEAIKVQHTVPSTLPQCFFVQDMEDAVRFAYQYTKPGKICLHSPASPSFGIFKDYIDRGNQFKYYVKKLGSSIPQPENNG
jgi:UDP-N-acetylmuramoylalanine-D-glutamate ligase